MQDDDVTTEGDGTEEWRPEPSLDLSDQARPEESDTADEEDETVEEATDLKVDGGDAFGTPGSDEP